jgi:hypothetical protein
MSGPQKVCASKSAVPSSRTHMPLPGLADNFARGVISVLLICALACSQSKAATTRFSSAFTDQATAILAGARQMLLDTSLPDAEMRAALF